MRKIRQLSLNYLPILYNSLILNNLRNIIATKDIYFIYIEENISKKLINKIVVTSSKFGSKYFTLKLLYYNDLAIK